MRMHRKFGTLNVQIQLYPSCCNLANIFLTLRGPEEFGECCIGFTSKYIPGLLRNILSRVCKNSPQTDAIGHVILEFKKLISLKQQLYTGCFVQAISGIGWILRFETLDMEKCDRRDYCSISSSTWRREECDQRSFVETFQCSRHSSTFYQIYATYISGTCKES